MGCLLYELLTLRHAFEGNNMRGLVVKILRGVYPPIPAKFSKDTRDLVAIMLSKVYIFPLSLWIVLSNVCTGSAAAPYSWTDPEERFHQRENFQVFIAVDSCR